MSFSDEDFQEFKIEAIELLDEAEKALLELSADSDFQNSYQTIFRSFHNLKGAAGMMEALALQAHTHEVETIFTNFKNAEGMKQEEVDFFLRAIDGARDILEGRTLDFVYEITPASSESIEETSALVEELVAQGLESEEAESQTSIESNSTESEVEPQEVATDSEPLTESTDDNVIESVAAGSSSGTEGNDVEQPIKFNDNQSLNFATSEFFVEAREMVDKMFSSLLALENDFSASDEVSELYRQAHSLKGAAGLFGYQELGGIAHDLESSLDRLRSGEGEISQELIDKTYKDLKIIEKTMAQLSGAPDSSDEALEMTEQEQRVEATAAPEKVVNLQQEPVPVEEPVAANKEEIQPSATESKKVPKSPAREGDPTSTSVRVSVRLLDQLMALMGEMVLVRNQMIQYTNNSDDMDFHNLSKKLSVVTSEIQEQMMKTRMQPIGNVLNKFQRVVRDLSKKLDKDIHLVIEGAETELDKSLLEAIKDPLTHIVRNSCDHGIETKEQRRASEKSVKGTIQIKAFHEGGQVVIEVKDDGKGLDKQAIINKAIERNLVNMNQAERMSDSEIYNLIFSSGFSTAKQVTNVSGRGVGMDVVATNIESIGGTVEIKSSQGHGTSFFLKIPLTLAIVPALIVTCGDNRIAIPQVKLHELVRVDQSSNQRIEMIQGTPVFRLRGNILPLIDLRSVLSCSEEQSNTFSNDEVINIAVIQSEGQLIGFIVDRIMDTADIVVKPLNKLLKSLQVYSGATVLGDGSVALILDIQGIRKVMDMSSLVKDKNGLQDSGADRYQPYDAQDFLLVELQNPTKHAILLNFVHRLEEFSRDQVEMSGHSPVIRYRDQVLPLISCSQEFGFISEAQLPAGSFPVIVVERAGRFYGLVVEQIVDTLQTNAEVQLPVEKRQGVIGNLNLDDELVIVIDPIELIDKRFPLALESKVGKTVQVEAQKRSLQSQILLVEDTPLFRKTIQASLEQFGYSVEFAINGQQAMELLNNREKPFDLIVSDIEMPKMNGFELAQAVRTHSVHKATPMLALSSRFDDQYQARGYESGFNCYMEKFKPEILQSKVQELIYQEKVA